jgi:hypothetical protein
MLTEISKSDKIGLGYWGYFAQAKEIFLRYSNSKICQIASLTLFCVFILVNTVAHAGWSEPVRISKPAAFMYPQMLAHGDTIHVVFQHWTRGRDIGYVRSTNAGETWSQEIGLTDTVNTDVPQFPKIMAWGQTTMAVWIAHLSDWTNYESIHYSISTDDGISWSQDQRITSTDSRNIVYFAASNADSLINIMFYSRPQTDTLAFYNIRSTDFGQNWSQPRIVFSSTESDIPDQISKGNVVHYAWGGGFSWFNQWETYYFRSTDGGLTWLDNISISSIDNLISESPAIAVNSSGNPAISWWDFKYSPYQTTGDILFRQSTDQGESWGLEEQITTNHLCDFSDICWSDDTLRAVWVDHRFGINGLTVYYSFKADTSQYWSPEERLDNDTASSIYPVIAASNGNIYIVWYHSGTNPDTSIRGGIYFTKRVQEPDKIREGSALPKEGKLSAYPNPFNSSVTISYSNLNRGSDIAIYDIQGRSIKVLKSEGKEGKIIWDATNAKGNKVSCGEYFLKAIASQQTYRLKLVYLK